MNALYDSLSVDDIIATINRSNAKSIIVEGENDLILFRRIEQEFLSHDISVFPVGGRNRVLELFDRIKEINVPDSVIFFADKDLWVYKEVPEKFESSEIFLTTDGYSIENDLFVDGDLESLMLDDEYNRFRNDLSKFTHWYSIAVSRLLSGQVNQTIVDHPRSIIQNEDIFQAKCKLEKFEDHPTEIYDKIYRDYRKLIRGKSLMSLISLQLSAQGRNPKYSHSALLEFGVVADGESVRRVREWVKNRFIIT